MVMCAYIVYICKAAVTPNPIPLLVVTVLHDAATHTYMLLPCLIGGYKLTWFVRAILD